MNELDQLAAAQAAIVEHNHNLEIGTVHRIETDTGALDAAISEAKKPLVEALKKAADTFADLKLGLRLLGKPDVARACEIAEEETRKVIPE